MAVLAVAAAIFVPGGRDVKPAGASAAAGPAWTKACWSSPPRNDRRLLERCVRVTGRVLWIRREGPDPGDKAHVMMASGLRLVLARYDQAGIHRLPGIGHSATITGPLVRSRSGLDEVQVFAEA